MKLANLPLVAACFLAVSCGPSKYAIDLEMRQPSKSGVDLVGKDISVVYLDDGRQENTAFCRALSSGFISALEKDYGMPEGTIGLYRIPFENGGVYASRDTMFNILMDTGADLVFLLDTVKFGPANIGAPAKVDRMSSADSTYISSCSVPFSIKLFCYDGMDPQDKVKSFSGSTTASTSVYSDGASDSSVMLSRFYAALPDEAQKAGNVVSSSFISQWKTQQFSFMYFYSSELWTNALNKALEYDWKGAVDAWMKCLDSSSDPLKRACAEYNIAVVCHIIGNDTLASEWLDRSDAENALEESLLLRKRLKIR